MHGACFAWSDAVQLRLLTDFESVGCAPPSHVYQRAAQHHQLLASRSLAILLQSPAPVAADSVVAIIARQHACAESEA